MALLPPNLPFFVPEDRYPIGAYLAIERASGKRYEFHDGVLLSVEAMAGGSFLHSVIGMNVGRVAGNALIAAEERDGAFAQCNAASSDLRIAVDGGKRYLYADAAIVCGDPVYDEEIPTAIVNPVSVFEVISPSSDGYDRGLKFAFYGMLPYLREYVILEQERRHVEVRSRHSAEAAWRTTTYADLEAAVELPSLGIDLPMAGLYRGWTPERAQAERERAEREKADT